MNLSSIKFRLIAAFLAIGFVLFLFMIIIVPGRTKATAEKVMIDNVEFTVKLLSDNLAIGMQTRELDQGASLQQTLDLLKGDAISSVAVLDQEFKLVKSLKADRAQFRSDTLANFKKNITAFRTLKDTDGKIQGYVEIEFSKHSFIESVNRFMLFIWVAGLVTLVAILIIGWVISNRIILPLNRSVQMLQDIAAGQGDLTKRLTFTSQDEVGKQEAYWINAFIDNLQSMVTEIKRNGDELNEVSERLSSISSDTSGLALNMKGKAEKSSRMMQSMSTSLDNVKLASQDTTTAVRTIAASIEVMSSSINEVAKNCQHESAIARRADDMALKAKDRINSLEEMAQQIGTIVGLIKDITDRTNLLSINAAIQAASAGDAGREFAVVANEVKDLAKQTAKAAEEIDGEIDHIRETVNSSVEEINGIATIIREVNTISQSIVQSVDDQSAAALEISRSINMTSSNADKMMQICETNVNTISEIGSNISEVHVSAEKTEQGVQKNRESIMSMTGTVEKLKKLVGRFKI